MKITLIAHKYSLKVKMLYITRHCLIFFCIQGLIRVLIYVTLSPKQTLFQWALYKGIQVVKNTLLFHSALILQVRDVFLNLHISNYFHLVMS